MSSLEIRKTRLVTLTPTKRPESRRSLKHRGMIEKKLERYYHESEELGWSYDAFVASVLEILTVLHHRNQKREANANSL
jgi:hypothetical protein